MLEWGEPPDPTPQTPAGGWGPPPDPKPAGGLLTPGNIDLTNRPRVKNPDGSTSTVLTIGVGIDGGREVNIPRVSDDGRILTNDEAIKQFQRTGKHLGIYTDAETAAKAAQALHEDQAQTLNTGWGAPPDPKGPGAEPSLWQKVKGAATAAVGTVAALQEAAVRSVNPEFMQPVITTVGKAVPTVARVGGAVAGGMVGGLPGSAAGAGLGELAAEGVEISHGTRQEVNPLQVGVQTALGAIPVGKVAGAVSGAVKRGIQGAVIGGAGTAATDLAEGRTPSVEGVATGAALGAAIGGPMGVLEGRAASRVAAAPPSIDHIPEPIVKGTEVPEAVMAPEVPPGQPPIHTTGGLSHGTGPDFTTEELAKARATIKTEADAKAGVTAPPVRPFKLTTNPDEINQKTFYHGTGTEIAKAEHLDPSVTKAEGLFGQGIYLTDNPDIAKGYAGARGRKTEPRIYEARVNVSQVLNLEEPLAQGPRQVFEQQAQRIAERLGDDEIVKRLQKLPPTATGEEVMRSFSQGVSDASHYHEVPAHEFYEDFGDISTALKEQGYDALTHTGGRRTGKDPHQVLILLDPNDQFANTGRKGQVTSWAMRAPEAPSAVSTPSVSAMVRPQGEAAARASGEPIPKAEPLPETRKVEERMVAHLPEDQRQGTLDIIQAHGGFEAQRRGVQPVERTLALAKFFDDEAVTRKLKPGTTMNAEEVAHLNNVTATINDDITTLAQKILDDKANGVINAGDALKLEKLRLQQVVLNANRLGVHAELGRGLNILKQMAIAGRTADEEMLQRALKQVNPDDVEAFAKKWIAAPDDVSKMKLLRDQGKLTKWEALEAVRYAGMLSGIRTSARNILGSSANILFRTASHVPATMYDMARSATTGAPRTLYLSELAPEAVGAVTGLGKGFSSFMATLKHGFNPEGLTAFDTPRKELRGGGANPLNWPTRFLEAQDAWMYSTVYHKELAGRAFAEARSEGLAQGLRGQALETFTRTKTANALVEPSAAVAAAARQEALHTLYREDAGPAVSWLLSASKKKGGAGAVGKALKFVIPFAKVPANIIRQSAENLPGGALITQQGRASLAAGGRESAEAMGRMATGGTILAAFAYLASQGKLSGSGPSDSAERADLLAQGWKPNSVKIGDTWVEYSTLGQSISAPLFAMANLWERMHQTGKAPTDRDAMDLVNGISGGVAGMGKSILDQSFLSGASDLFQAVNDGDRYGARYLERQAQSFVPFGGLSRNVAQAIDPVVRDPTNPIEGVKAMIPGLSQTVAPHLTPFGDEAKRTGSAIERGFSPIGRSPEVKDPVIQTMNDLGLSIGEPLKTLQKTRTQPTIALTVDERKSVGMAARKAAETLTNNPAFQAQVKGNDQQRAYATTALKSAMDRARDAVYTQIRLSRRRPR